MELSVYKALTDAAKNWPSSPAVHDEHGTLSFKQLLAETEELKNTLLRLGVKKGMCVGVMARNSRNFISGIFAVVGCGATAMPMSHQLKEPEINDILAEAKLHAILDDKHGVTPIRGESVEIKMNVESFRFAFSTAPRDEAFAPFVVNPAFMRYTSGTTGKSKGVIVSHQSAFERIESANKVLALGVGDTVVWVLPMAYHFIVSILLYIRFGAAIAIAKDFLSKNIIEITNAHHGTLLYASPIQLKLLASNTDSDQMPSLKKVISTSAAISVDVCKAFKKRFNLDVSQAYGIIEIGLPIINYKKSAEHPDAVGYALPDYQIDILDDEFNPVSAGTIGHLAINGPGMFDAYLSPPALRKEVLKNGYFLTADFARKLEDGLIKVEGREKSMINVSGSKVFPEEVEGVLESIPEIKLARISGVPHPLLGQAILAEVILHEGKQIDEETVLTYCRKQLSAFKIPHHIKVVMSLPLTGSGKVQR
jgi:acyl-coenzyme A synthetase/AMP-(fatty) acid ligase